MRRLIVGAAILVCVAFPAQARDAREGERAPDFRLRRLAKSEAEAKESVGKTELLSELIKRTGKPVVLIFGSYT